MITRRLFFGKFTAALAAVCAAPFAIKAAPSKRIVIGWDLGANKPAYAHWIRSRIKCGVAQSMSDYRTWAAVDTAYEKAIA